MTDIAIDTEFLENGRAVDLISIGLACEDGREYYAVNSEAPWDDIAKHRWLCENVVPHLPLTGRDRKVHRHDHGGYYFFIDYEATCVRPRQVIANEVRDFIVAAPEPALWADWSSYDHVVLAQLFGTMTQLPIGIPMWVHELRQEHERAGSPDFPPMPGATEHDALSDAREVLWRLRWLREREGQ